MAVAPVVRRVLRRHVHDERLLDDLCQEVLSRLWAAADRLDPATMSAYARAVALNVLRNHQRDERNQQWKLARAAAVPDQSAPADEDADLGGAESKAVRAALEQLSAADRRLLEDHLSHEPPTDRHASGTIRVRLLRARARVRYLLALRGATPASDRCLPVLDALSAGDRARQRAIGAQSHLAGCELCASLAEEVVRRERPLPILVLLGGAAALWRALRQHPAVSVAGASAAVAVGVALASAGGEGEAPVSAPPTAAVSTTRSIPPSGAALATPERTLLPVPPDVGGLAGSAVQAHGVPVRRVVGGEALWVGTSEQDQLLVVLLGPGESPQTIVEGQLLDFTGRLMANQPDLAAVAGVDESEGLELLVRQGVHLEVAHSALVVR